MRAIIERLKYFLRFMLFLTISDAKRKKLKKIYKSLIEIPIRFLGIKSYLDQQYEDLNRLKGYQFHLDGKLNALLYGMPRVNRYSAEVLNSVRQAGVSQSDVISVAAREELVIPAVPAPLLAEINENNSEKALLFGPRECVVDQEIRASARTLIVDYVRLGDQLDGAALGNLVLTDPLTALQELSGKSFDRIWVIDRLHHLQGADQAVFIRSVTELLSENGEMVISLPDIEDLAVLTDFYWRDARAMRPYSKSYIHGELESAGLTMTCERLPGSAGDFSRLAMRTKRKR